MANHPSAEKRHRQSLKRRTRNRTAKAAISTVTKKALEAIDNKDTSLCGPALKAAAKSLDKAASKGIVHKKNAQRRISRLQKKANKVLAK